MNTFALKLSAHEIQTRQLFNDALETQWLSYRVMIAHVFVNDAASALPVNRIVDRIMATNALRQDARLSIEEQVRKNLTKFTREKVLRSRRAGGETLYEVNY